jgi:nucleoside-diphosphate-sugar epimerase
MILFTGSGALAKTFLKMYPCKIISARNITDKELEKWIIKAEVIVHNAALIYSDVFDDFINANFILTKRILCLIDKINPNAKFVNISSMSILSNENEYLSPDKMSNYAFSKFITEQYCYKHPLEKLINVRFSTIFYGDGKRDGISKLVEDSFWYNKITIYNEGEAKRDIIPIRIAAMYLFKICNLKIINRKMNIVSGKAISFKEISVLLHKGNSKLIVLEKKIEANNVLSNFSKRDVELLGEVKFELNQEIKLYKEKLHESSNLQ